MGRGNVELWIRGDLFQPVARVSGRIEQLELNATIVSPMVAKTEPYLDRHLLSRLLRKDQAPRFASLDVNASVSLEAASLILTMSQGHLFFSTVGTSLRPAFGHSSDSTSHAIRLAARFVEGEGRELVSRRNFREVIEKICVTATAVSL